MQSKDEQRKAMLCRRDALTKQAQAALSAQITSALCETALYRQSRSVCIYVSCRSEVDTHSLICRALADGKTVSVPVCLPNFAMMAARITDFSDMEKNRYGILEPIKKEPVGALDLCIIPGAVFDIKGGRIGYGKGYYDRFLQQNPCKKLALCFSLQLTEAVLQGPHDVAMDYILTEKGMIRI